MGGKGSQKRRFAGGKGARAILEKKGKKRDHLELRLNLIWGGGNGGKGQAGGYAE